ncbi:hypothetical protein EDC96DRAFT_548784 [Choanephora cucurbitarum]|nr:hypothetical protein EDC96DRAFT_548784 [Choanephora cucurbitarum]
MPGYLSLCFCDECINFPEQERWLPKHTVRYHKGNNLFGGMTYNEWPLFYTMSQQGFFDDNEGMAMEDDHVMEEVEDFSILITEANNQDWTEILGFEPETSTEVVEIDEVDQLVDAFSSTKVPHSVVSKIFYMMVTKLNNKYTTHEGTEFVMDCLNQVLEETGRFLPLSKPRAYIC